MLPFAIWNFRGLWHDLVLFHLAPPFRDDSLSFAVPYPFFLKIEPVIVLAFIVWTWRNRIRNAATFAAGYAVSLMLLFRPASKHLATTIS